jgi:hypothetical protein
MASLPQLQHTTAITTDLLLPFETILLAMLLLN